MFYGRANDAWDNICKAVDIIKRNHEAQKMEEENIQKRWQFKLGLPDGMEIPNIEKISEEHVKDVEFLKGIAETGVEISTLELYLRKVCPKIRDPNDKNVFLNELIEELYYKVEDAIAGKKKNIENIEKKVEQLGLIQEVYEAMGSDADNDPKENFRDDKDEPIRFRKKKKQMCPHVFLKKMYKDDGIDMIKKTETKKDGGVEIIHDEKKYYMSKLKKHFPLNQRTGELSCLLCDDCKNMITKNKKEFVMQLKTGEYNCRKCPNSKNCPDAHNPIELDLVKYTNEIQNLKDISLAQTVKMKNAKPIEPWQPSNKFIDKSKI